MHNKKLGNDFEQELCELLADAGFWVHNFANRKNGQPADIIAVKGRLAFLIDAKVCSGDVFRFSRVEDNQRYAMEAWIGAGNGTPYFAINKGGKVYMVSYEAIKEAEKKGKKQIKLSEIKSYGMDYSTWIKIVSVQ